MPYTEQQIQTLRDALANGVRRVRFADREVEYRDLAELREALAAAEAEFARTSGKPVARHIRISTEKGF